MTADRSVSLPIAAGPTLPGVPADDHGFVPADDFGRVPGLERVYAAGDGKAALIKQVAWLRSRPMRSSRTSPS